MWKTPSWISYFVVHAWIVALLGGPRAALGLQFGEPCDEGAVKQDPEDCSSYLLCLNGEVQVQRCARQSYFDPAWEVCIIDVNGVCATASRTCSEGEINEIPGNNCAYAQCIDGQSKEENCPLGSYFNPDLKVCEVDVSGVCPQCLENELQADPGDCSGYLKCVNGDLVAKRCARGSYFNARLKVCEVDGDGSCVPARCKDGSLEEDPADCAGYLKCDEGKLVERKCAQGSYFNVGLQICQVDENGFCSGDCTEGDLVADPNDCAAYRKCIGGDLVKEQCASGSFFNPSLKACEIDAAGSCVRLTAQCLEHEQQPDPDDCAAYLGCQGGELIRKVCPYGSYYHSVLQSCIVDAEGVCTPLSERCGEGDRESDPNDCASYLECIDGDFIQQQCVKGSFFDTEIRACIVDERRVCVK